MYRYVNLTSDVCSRLAGTTKPRLRSRSVARARRCRTRLSPHTTRQVALTRWARDNSRLPIKATSNRPQTPASVAQYERSCARRNNRDFGAETSIASHTHSSISPENRSSGRHSRTLSTIAARLAKPCDPTPVSAKDVSNSETASRRYSTSTRVSVSSRFSRKTFVSL